MHRFLNERRHVAETCHRASAALNDGDGAAARRVIGTLNNASMEQIDVERLFSQCLAARIPTTAAMILSRCCDVNRYHAERLAMTMIECQGDGVSPSPPPTPTSAPPVKKRSRPPSDETMQIFTRFIDERFENDATISYDAGMSRPQLLKAFSTWQETSQTRPLRAPTVHRCLVHYNRTHRPILIANNSFAAANRYHVREKASRPQQQQPPPPPITRYVSDDDDSEETSEDRNFIVDDDALSFESSVDEEERNRQLANVCVSWVAPSKRRRPNPFVDDEADEDE